MVNQPEEGQPDISNIEEDEDFAALFEASGNKLDRPVVRDSKVEGTIISIGEEWVFVDIAAKSEGAIAREELLDENGELPYNIGDKITAYVVNSRRDEIILSVKITSAASEEALRDASRTGVPVEGLVAAERKGGYTVLLFGKQAFCPFSQIDLPPAGTPENYIDRKFTFRVMEYSEKGRNIVLSRRELLEEERRRELEKLKAVLKTGDVLQGTVQKLANFGAFVNIGAIEGLIPMSELAWYRVNDAADVLTPGEKVTVKILDLDWDRNRISLSLKQVSENPWDSVAARFSEAQMVKGTVTKLMDFGAFVQIEPGIEGLVHISQLGMGRKVNHPREAVSEGDEVDVKILAIDQGAHRISLELIPGGTPEVYPDLKEGEILEGTVEALKDYGIFVNLPGNKSGLLHVSEIEGIKQGELRSRFPMGSKIQVQIKAVDSETKKISLTMKTLQKAKEESHFKDFNVQSGKNSFGTLGDLLKEKLRG